MSTTVSSEFPLVARFAPIIFWCVGATGLVGTVNLMRIGVGLDAHAYWVAGRALSYDRPPGVVDAFLYSPLFADAIRPLALLPWPLFYVLWAVLQALALYWLLRPLSFRWAFPAVCVSLPEIVNGNIHVLLAAALVLGMSGSRAVWLLPVLTKVSTGVGLLWYLARGEWRRLAEVGALLVLVVGCAYLVQPQDWNAWVEMLIRNRSAGQDGPALLVIRLVAAVTLTVLAARADAPWMLAFALVLANPVSWATGLTMLAAIPQLRTTSVPLQAHHMVVLPEPTRVAARAV